MKLSCPRDDCNGQIDLGDVHVVAFDLGGDCECPACGQRCKLPDDYIDVDDPATWWLVESDA